MFELYPYSCVFSSITVRQRNDTRENDTWSVMEKTFGQFGWNIVSFVSLCVVIG